MGAQRHDQDSHARRLVPKLIPTGRLTGTLDGLPVEIEASERGITLSLASVRSLIPLSRSARQAGGLLAVLRHAAIPLDVRLFSTVSLQVLPQPHWLVRLVMPGHAS